MIWGAGLALASAATFGFNNVSVRRGILTGSIVQAMALTVPLGIPLFLVAALITGELFEVGRFALPTTVGLAAAGVLHFGIGRYANYRAIRAMGSNLSGAVSEISIVVAVLLAVVLLNERLSIPQLIGIGLIFLGAFAVRERTAGMGTAVFHPNVAEGYVFSLVSATAYGTSPILIRSALAQANLPSAAGLISYVAATAAFIAVVAASGSLPHLRAVPRSALPWFVLSGLFVGLSQVFRYVALSLAPVTVVTPIQRLSLVFRALFGLAINREYEAWNARVIFALVVALLGGVVVALG